MYPKIPEHEITWLRGLDSQWKAYKSHSMEAVYPVDILPPKLKTFVKGENRDIEFVNLGLLGDPDVQDDEGDKWCIWGWKELPEKANKDAEWSHVITAEGERPSAADVQAKIQHIQAELAELTKLVGRL